MGGKIMKYNIVDVNGNVLFSHESPSYAEMLCIQMNVINRKLYAHVERAKEEQNKINDEE
jgi:hypothetical protein